MEPTRSTLGRRRYHHGKHHNAYVVNLNNLIKGTEYENLTSKPSSRRPRPAASTTTPPRSGTTPSSGTA
jgi:Fe-Mn family superoxide dismutase